MRALSRPSHKCPKPDKAGIGIALKASGPLSPRRNCVFAGDTAPAGRKPPRVLGKDLTGSSAPARRCDGGTAMTIGKKLYLSFGAGLAMVVVLFLVNLVAVSREHSAKAAAASSLHLADATDSV